jgi:Uma2 family endonuclease
MIGTRVNHNKLQMNFTGEVRNFLKGKSCDVFSSDLRIYISSDTLFTYLDAVIVCGEFELLDEEFDTVLNPIVVVEVLSKSTRSYDRGDEFMLYRSIKTLQEYILIDSL